MEWNHTHSLYTNNMMNIIVHWCTVTVHIYTYRYIIKIIYMYIYYIYAFCVNSVLYENCVNVYIMYICIIMYVYNVRNVHVHVQCTLRRTHTYTHTHTHTHMHTDRFLHTCIQYITRRTVVLYLHKYVCIIIITRINVLYNIQEI